MRVVWKALLLLVWLQSAMGARWPLTRLPVNGALFLPRDMIDESELYYQESKNMDYTGQYHLATIENVLPIMDIAIRDARRRYLPQWTDQRPWLRLRPTPIGDCDDQKAVAWAVQKAIHWTNGSRVRFALSFY
jgi:hypothetical protein